MKLEARYADRPAYAPVNVVGLGEMQARSLTALFESDGYTVTVTSEQYDIDAKAAARAAKAAAKDVPSAS